MSATATIEQHPAPASPPPRDEALARTLDTAGRSALDLDDASALADLRLRLFARGHVEGAELLLTLERYLLAGDVSRDDLRRAARASKPPSSRKRGAPKSPKHRVFGALVESVLARRGRGASEAEVIDSVMRGAVNLLWPSVPLERLAADRSSVTASDPATLVRQALRVLGVNPHNVTNAAKKAESRRNRRGDTARSTSRDTR